MAASAVNIICLGISDQKAQKIKDIVKQNQLVSVGFMSVSLVYFKTICLDVRYSLGSATNGSCERCNYDIYR